MKVTISENIIWREVDGEAVILNMDNSNYYSLNEVGTRVWKMFAKGCSVDDIVRLIDNEYSADASRVRKDVQKLIGELKREKLVATKV